MCYGWCELNACCCTIEILSGVLISVTVLALIGENEDQVSVLRALEYILPAANSVRHTRLRGEAAFSVFLFVVSVV